MTSVAQFLARLQKLGVNLSASGGRLPDTLPDGLTGAELDFAQTRSADIARYLLARRLALPAYKSSGVVRVVCSLTQESWFRWSGQAAEQVKNDRIAFTHLFLNQNVEAAERALRTLIGRHEALRLSFAMQDGAVVSSLMAVESLPIEIIDASGLSDAALQADLAAFHGKKIPLDGGWSLHARLCKIDAGVLCALSLHHLIVDGYSLALLKADLVREEMGGATEAAVSFLDYATQERDWFEGAGGAAAEDYWVHWLAQQEPLRAPGNIVLQWQPGECIIYTYKIGNGVQKRLARVAAELRTRLFFLYMGAYATALAEWSGQNRFALRINGSLRTSPNLLPLAGNMITADMVTCDLTAAEDFSQILRNLEADYRAATQVRLPHLFGLPTRNGAHHTGKVRMAGAIAATINYFSVRGSTGDLRKHEEGMEAPSLQGVHSEIWDIPVWPIYLRLIDADDGVICRFEFHAGQIPADAREDLIRIVFAHLQALLAPVP